jgi:hypothetical protein
MIARLRQMVVQKLQQRRFQLVYNVKQPIFQIQMMLLLLRCFYYVIPVVSVYVNPVFIIIRTMVQAL